ncbi:protein S40-7-like [Actinidia eriantha]|uniref:protein S40-7-like n=1 Tax=Actinidia eriantha TaxID=165200 RepID=UPI00258A7D18|nr:protein S40-7-like [Actinidia eriantha]
MEPSGGAAASERYRIRGPTSPYDRFLGVPETAVPGVFGEELSEEDVFWTGDFAQKNLLSSAPSTSAPPENHRLRHRIGPAEDFGILAALPPTGSDRTRSVFNHKASVSSSSASSSIRIPMVRRRLPPDRPAWLKFHQSAPVNVPVMSKETLEAMRRSRARYQFDHIDDDDDGDGEMLPPHEVIASRQSPMVTCSVLEGVGRTLKGRDLRQVRNAVFRKTGFMD